MKVGNIVTNVDYDYDDCLLVFESVESIPSKNTLPTLIVGREIAKKYLNGDYSVNVKRPNHKLWWTFGIKEIRQQFENDLPDFIEHCFNNLIKDIQYIYLDPIQDDMDELKKRFKELDLISQNNELSGFIYNDNMVYLYGSNRIYGIDLSIFDFAGYRKEITKKRIIDLTKGRLYKNNILIECKEELEFLDNKIKYAPYLYILKNDQNRTIGNLY